MSAKSEGAAAVGALAVAALALGVIAIGYVAVSYLSVRRMNIRHARFKILEIDDLIVRRMHEPQRPGLLARRSPRNDSDDPWAHPEDAPI